jgi:Zn-dependent protease
VVGGTGRSFSDVLHESTRTMLRSWKLGRAFGIDVFIHWSFPLILLYVLWEFGHTGPGVTAFVELLFLALFGCVLLHEYGHALMARYFGIRTRDITLYPIGGIARLERMSERPGEELAIALAGPAVNVLIAGVVGLVWWVANGFGPLHLREEIFNLYVGHPSVMLFLERLAWVNVVLVLFNLIPAFPMDGGRAFRAFLALGLGRVQATEVAVFVGAVLAGLGVLLGLAPIFVQQGPHWTLVLLSMFVFFLGQQELAMVRYRESLRHAPPIDVVPAHEFLDLSALPAEANFSGFTWDRRAGAWIEWRNGRPVHACRVEPS